MNKTTPGVAWGGWIIRKVMQVREDPGLEQGGGGARGGEWILILRGENSAVNGLNSKSGAGRSRITQKDRTRSIWSAFY